MTIIPHRLKSVEARVSQVETQCHPGLMLDKLLRGVPEASVDTKHVAPSVVGARGDGAYLKTLRARHAKVLEGAGATAWKASTIAPMALHLARAALLENANVCLHRTHGFAYLPGSGIKGMARAWAEMAWKEKEKPEAQATIERVFGKLEESGAVVFHDAWPTAWPQLEVDILACHHPKYYNGEGAPGDWEGPNLVNFLVVKAGTEFEFALSPRPGAGTDEDVKLARMFLEGALARRGAGAKTNASYGYFAAGKETPETTDAEKKLAFTCELELVTPAFLAGAGQSQEDCDLRGATLRGQLRWWWRTLHAGHLMTDALRQLEEAIWGSSSKGGAVSVRVEACEGMRPPAMLDRRRLGDERAAKDAEIEFRKAHHADAHHRTREANKVTPGLTYISYGMAEKDPKRWMRLPGSRWQVTMSFRETEVVEKDHRGREVATAALSEERVKQEALCALWLLVNHGGVGSKARKGFGSLRMSPTPQLDFTACESAAQHTRNALARLGPFRPGSAPVDKTPHLGDVMTFASPVVLPYKSRMQALQQIGFSLSLFAGGHAHQLEKKALGLPRRVGHPASGQFRPKLPVSDRHASPWHISLAEADGGLEVRFTAFPSPWLPDSNTSREWLTMLRNHLEADLRLRAAKVADTATDFEGLATNQPSAAGARAGMTAPRPQGFPATNSIVQATLSETKTKKGGWQASLPSLPGRLGPITNTGDVPADKNPGDIVQLVVHSASESSLMFRWPSAKDFETKAPKPQQGKRPPQGNRGWGQR